MPHGYHRVASAVISVYELLASRLRRMGSS